MQENVHRKSAQEKLRREEMHTIYTKKILKKFSQKQGNKKNAQKKCTENSTGKMQKKK